MVEVFIYSLTGRAAAGERVPEHLAPGKSASGTRWIPSGRTTA